jgi:hypothetical protein
MIPDGSIVELPLPYGPAMALPRVHTPRLEPAQPDEVAMRVQGEKRVRDYLLRHGRSFKDALSQPEVAKQENVVRALGRNSRAAAYDAAYVKNLMHVSGLDYCPFVPTHTPVIAPPRTDLPSQALQARTTAVGTKRKSPASSSNDIPEPPRPHRNYWQRPDTNSDIIAVEGETVPFHLVSRPTGADSDSCAGQYLGKLEGANMFVGPYALAWKDFRKGVELQQNSQPGGMNVASLIVEDGERGILADDIKLNAHGFLTEDSADRIFAAFPAKHKLLYAYALPMSAGKAASSPTAELSTAISAAVQVPAKPRRIRPSEIVAELDPAKDIGAGVGTFRNDNVISWDKRVTRSAAKRS